MIGPVAITREVSRAIGACELTHLDRVPIDVDRARAQHARYCRALAEAGYEVVALPAADDLPDSVFVEDAAVVFDELAIVMRPGAVSRRGEVRAVAEALAPYRDLEYIQEPATIDGGDLLAVGARVFVGLSTRTNGESVRQLRALLSPRGYSVCEVGVADCLHLKSAATCVDRDTVLLNPDWIDRAIFRGLDIVTIDASEPSAANVLRLRDRVIAAAAFPRTADRLAARGLNVVTVDASELAKAEGALTCCSLIVEDRA